MKLKKTMLASSLALAFSVNLLAQEVYTIQDKTLKEALEIISKKSNLSYIVNDKLLDSKEKFTIKNVEGLEKALQKLLQGTKYKAIIKNNAIVIVEKNPQVNSSSNELSKITVVGNKNNDSSQFYKVPSTASRLGMTIKETPASIEVLDSEIMLQRGDTTVTNAITKATGITGGASGHGPGGRFSVRGFAAVPGITFLNDGIKLNGSAFSKRAFETANLDRIEVIRGAASVLHGEGSAGASINLITKKPSFSEQETELDFRVGSHDSYRFQFGTGGVAINDVLAYRIDISDREKGSDIEGEKKEVNSLSTGFLYKINDDLLASFSIDKTKDETENSYIGTPLVNGKLDENVRTINYNTLTDGIDKGDNLLIRQNLEWNVNKSMELKNQLYYQNIDSEARRPYMVKQSTNDPTKVIIRGADLGQKQDLLGNRLDIVYKEDLFGLDNKLLLGTDISTINFKREISPSFGPGIETNMYNPASGTHGELNNKYRYKEIDVDITQLSLYLEDQLSITDNFKLVTGIRHDMIDVEWNYLRTNTIKDRTYNELSYRLGAVYDLNKSTTLYAAYSNSIESGGTSIPELRATQTHLDLTEAEQYEVGLRQSFLNNKAEFTASAYKITKKNMFVRDPNNPGIILNAGEQSSDGFEFSLNVQPIEELQIDTNLSIVDSQYDDFVTNKGSFTGKTPDSVPKYIANLGIRYMPTTNLGIGTWINHVGAFYIDDANTIELPSYTTIDLTLDYIYNDNVTFSFLAKNLTDELYATSSKNRPDVFLGEARSFEFGINYKF